MTTCFRFGLHSVFATLPLGAIFFSMVRPCLANDPAVEPKLLLQGVESTRAQIPPSRLTLRTSYQEALTQAKTNEIEVVFDRDRRRFLVKVQGPNQIGCLFDGTEVVHFDGSTATKRDTSSQTADLFFDPRILGITTTYWWSESVYASFPYREAKQPETVGRERVGTLEAWHVQVIDSYNQKLDIWIDDKNDFKVYRYDFTIDGIKRNSTLSFYENKEYPWLPSRVETHYYNAAGKEVAIRTISIVAAQAPVELPPQTWTLAGLPLPHGTPVVDLRIKERVGYWDGTGLKPTPGDAVESKRETTPPHPTKSGRSRAVWVFLSLSLAVVAVLLWLWKSRRKDLTAPPSTPPAE